LSKAYPDAWVVAMSLAEVRYLQGNMQDSLNQFSQLLERYPNSFPIGMVYSEYLIRDKKPVLAKKCLNRFVDKHNDSLTLQQRLTQVYRLLGDLSAMHQAQAEWHLLRGNTKAAKLQLELALAQLNTNKDLIEMAKIEAIQDKIRACEKIQ
jgi:predicted Zn-dependent protease